MTEVLPDEGGPATTSSFIECYDLSLDSFSSIGLPCPIVKQSAAMFRHREQPLRTERDAAEKRRPFPKGEFLFENKASLFFICTAGFPWGG